MGSELLLNRRRNQRMRKIDPRKLRRALGLNQTEFWGRIEVTQSGGSRYENGRRLPGPIRKLLGIVYLKEKP
jgi:DNA-binding transcriptional regulator YiaG